jgi:hypothetical protein
MSVTSSLYIKCQALAFFTELSAHIVIITRKLPVKNDGNLK